MDFYWLLLTCSWLRSFLHMSPSFLYKALWCHACGALFTLRDTFTHEFFATLLPLRKHDLFFMEHWQRGNTVAHSYQFILCGLTKGFGLWPNVYTLTSCYLILQHHHLGQLICFVVIGAWLKPVAPLGQFCPHFSLPQCPQTLCEEPVCGLCVCVFLQPLKKTLIPVVFVPCSFYMSYSFYLCLLRFISLISILHFVFLHIYFDGTALEVH